MENIFLGIITVAALFYLYTKLFKNKGCGCGKEGSCKVDEK
ncbi:FeoB-associated Cys-rich membrane protein [Arcobacter aquimarinus]|nr:FeoB-associated Cys-rich membrane protein [Arcobacter aquimarinus]MCB9097391.1 FeoB-associated Cys-rich membrane protein [Arcobacter sp.]RXI33175.1 FeoB-associated Cys-rich membrane protein [Arcobacter aquimarinus]